MRGVYLPGHSDVDIRELADPRPGPGQVLLAMRASTICGSDIRAIYREHLQGDPAEMYQDVVAGHEPAGEVVAVGPDPVRLKVGDRVADRALWTYPEPSRGYEALAGHVSVYPGRMDRCTVAGETVVPQEGGFYGGWITSKLVGPFKGAPGTWGW